MDKIVILTGEPEGKSNLVIFLRSLFPDCDIEIVATSAESKEEDDTPSYSLPLRSQKMGRA